MDELKKYNSESETPPRSQTSNQSQEQIKILKQSLEKAQLKINSLTSSLEQSQKHVKSLTRTIEQMKLQKPKIITNELEELSEEDLIKRGKRIRTKIIDAVNMDEEEFSQDQLTEILEEAIEIIEYARE